MVGIPRSTGCDICRRRKKKCGEERPRCLACVAAGWICPGYTKRWKFVDENAQLSAHYRTKRYSLDDADFEPTLGQHHEDQYDLICYEQYGARYGQLRPGLSRPLTSECDQTASMLAFILNDRSGETVCQLRSHANFIDYVPSRLGRNIGLDSVVSCLCSLYVDALTTNPTTESLRRYGKSMASLQICLKDPRRRFESETLCASILTQLCELLRSPGNGRWAYLSRGSKFLFKSIGPARCAGPFERAMIESQRAWFMVQDIGRRERCFLAQSQWRELFKMPITTPVDIRNPRLSLRSQLCDMLVDAPDLLSEVSRLSSAEGNRSLDRADLQAQREDVLSRVIAQKHQVETWRAQELEPLFRTCDSSQVYPTKVHASRHRDILLAVLDCISSSALIALADALLTLRSLLPGHGEDGHLISHQSAIVGWKAAVRASLDIVRETSRVASEPLECGLGQIWSVGRAK